MTKPICYHVSPVCGGWQVQYDHEPPTSQFGTRASAIEASREVAKLHWQMSGLATCVQIQDEHGTIVDDVSYGVRNDDE